MSDNMTEGINLIVLLAAVLFAFGVFVNKFENNPEAIIILGPPSNEVIQYILI